MGIPLWFPEFCRSCGTAFPGPHADHCPACNARLGAASGGRDEASLVGHCMRAGSRDVVVVEDNAEDDKVVGLDVMAKRRRLRRTKLSLSSSDEGARAPASAAYRLWLQATANPAFEPVAEELRAPARTLLEVEGMPARRRFAAARASTGWDGP